MLSYRAARDLRTDGRACEILLHLVALRETIGPVRVGDMNCIRMPLPSDPADVLAIDDDGLSGGAVFGLPQDSITGSSNASFVVMGDGAAKTNR